MIYTEFVADNLPEIWCQFTLALTTLDVDQLTLANGGVSGDQ